MDKIKITDEDVIRQLLFNKIKKESTDEFILKKINEALEKFIDLDLSIGDTINVIFDFEVSWE
jgi:hypothetical protein